MTFSAILCSTLTPRGEETDRSGSYAEDQVTILYAHAARAAPPIIHMTEGRIIPDADWPIPDPNSATCSDPQNAIAVPKARRNPNGWAAADATNIPSAANANAVVIPQVGQGLSSMVAQEHSRIPSCVCVP